MIRFARRLVRADRASTMWRGSWNPASRSAHQATSAAGLWRRPGSTTKKKLDVLLCPSSPGTPMTRAFFHIGMLAHHILHVEGVRRSRPR